MRPRDGSSLHPSVGDPIMRLHKAYLTFTSAFWSPPPGGVVERFLLLNFSESLCVFFETGLSWAIVVPIIMDFLSTVVAGDVVQISPGSLLLIFSVTFIVPSFTAFHKHELVAEPVGLEISIRVIIRLMV